MTGDLVPIPTFEGKEIRVLQKDGEAWFPLTDLAAAWGTDLATPYHIVERNPDVFYGFSRMSCDIDVTATSGRCVSEQGLYLLMGKISADRLKNKAARAAIIRFQRWVPELIQRYRKKEIVQKPEPLQELDEVVAYDLKEAKQIADLTGTDPRAMQAAILEKHGYPELAVVLSRQLPALHHGETGWYSITQLVARCNDPLLNPERLNHYLSNNPKDPERRPYQYRDENHLWRLTPLGMEHGREYPYNTPSGHSEPRIAWRESVLYASGLKRQISNDQAALTAKAGS